MKTRTDVIHGGNLICRVFCFCLFWFAPAMILEGYMDPIPPVDVLGQKEKPEQDTIIRVSVDEVRIDAVVLDWRYHQITDLTADDFAIYQDGIKQDIISCIYVNDSAPRSGQKKHLATAPAPSREEIRRTILFLVDDLSMSFENLHFTRMALKNFVEKQMQPGDLVGILRTSIASGPPFSANRRALLSAIEKIQWGAQNSLANCGPSG